MILFSCLEQLLNVNCIFYNVMILVQVIIKKENSSKFEFNLNKFKI